MSPLPESRPMPSLFGTDGVRGTANTTLTPELALALGKSAGRVLAGRSDAPRFLIGRDTRASGEMLEAALVAGVCSAGVDAVSLGVATTPAVATLTRLQDFAAGIVISASHNPAAENGIKFLGPDGSKLPDAVEREIEASVADLEGRPFVPGGHHEAGAARVGRYTEEPDLLAGYAAAARASIPVSLPPYRVVVDAAHGAGYRLNVEVLRSLGLQVQVIHDAPDGVNINLDAGSTHPETMCRAVTEAGADIGAAFDGDGDRVILADENGALVDGDHVMAMCAHQWVDTPDLPGNTVVGTVMSNIGLEESLGSIKVRLVRASVGDRYVAEQMRRTGAAVGGEKSGHIIFARHATTGDGLITLLQVLSLMARSGKPLSELASVMREYPQVLIGVRVRRKDGWDGHPDVARAMSEAEQALHGRGRLLVRPSGTENLIRIMAEGPDLEEIRAIVGGIAEAIRRHNEE